MKRWPGRRTCSRRSLCARRPRQVVRGLGDLGARREQLCRDALNKIEVSDYISAHADTLVSLADVLHLQGKDAEATTRLRDALALYERKENIVSARKVLDLLV